MRVKNRVQEVGSFHLPYHLPRVRYVELGRYDCPRENGETDMISVAIMIGLLIVFLVVVSVGFYEIFGDVVYQLRDINLQLARINETVRNREKQT